jgi:superfamily II DNA or RNA helicase
MRVFNAVARLERRQLNIQLPTGYGKTLTGCGVYSILQKNKGFNRVLFITPTDGQHEQFVKDGRNDMADCGVVGPHDVKDVRFFQWEAVKAHRKNASQIFAINIQSLITSEGTTLINEMMSSGVWLVIVDEYHHYGDGKRWGDTVRSLRADFFLAMSATPHRENDDSAFGIPEVVVSYAEAVKEGAVKPLRGHSYVYRIEVIEGTGDVKSITTSELAALAGDDTPEIIERYCIERNLRWSPHYVGPLISHPLERLTRDRLTTGLRLQAIVTAMCVSHAKLVCEQVSAMFPELNVEWVGTGPNGRKPEENREIIRKFCPPKVDGVRPRAGIDVLVHVGMAGEGLDTSNVSEIIFLKKVNATNSNIQVFGRAARALVDGTGQAVVGHINFDSSSEFAERGFVGSALMNAMDLNEPGEATEDSEETQDREIDYSLPEEPTILNNLLNIELDEIDSGSEEFARFIESMKKAGVMIPYEQALTNKDVHRQIIEIYRAARRTEAEAHDERSQVEQWNESVATAVTKLTGLILKKMGASVDRFDKNRAGQIKYKINTRKKQVCGAVSPEIHTLRAHWNWCRNLAEEIDTKGIPLWLS